MRKTLALVLVGAMLVAMPVMAAESPAASTAVETSSATVQEQASSFGMSVPEYQNNAVTHVPGIPNTAPVAQGGKAVINGKATNFTMQLKVPTKAEASAAIAQAAVVGGNVKALVSLKNNIPFKTAVFNLYVQGLKADSPILVYQFINGQWVEVPAVAGKDSLNVAIEAAGPILIVEKPFA